MKYTVNKIDSNRLLVEESLFTLGNGYLGVRGCFEEGYNSISEEIRGTYINGIYARIPIKYPESAYGFPQMGDRIPRIFDAQSMEIFLDGELLSFDPARYQDYHRTLDMEKGISIRRFAYTTRNGKQAVLSFERLVSFEIKELFVTKLNINYTGKIKVNSYLKQNVSNFHTSDDPRVAAENSQLLAKTTSTIEQDCLYTQSEIVGSGINVACMVYHEVEESIKGTVVEDNKLLYFTAENENSLELLKYSVYCDSLRHSEVKVSAQEITKQANRLGYEQIKKLQVMKLVVFWKYSRIKIDDEKIQNTLDFSVFQLYQSVGKDKLSNIASKGLSGEGYEGHYFWESETYIIPYYLTTMPEIAKNMLLYRYNHIELARNEARLIGAKRGIKFAWRTISGIECSAYFPAGQAQYHINADIAFAITQYYFATKDCEFLIDFGIEMLLEICLFFLEVGNFNHEKFSICGVTGPDEYSAIIDNDYYTNAMVKLLFENTLKLLDEINPKSKMQLLDKVGFDEIDLFKITKAAKQMVMLYDENRKINIKNQSFENRADWDETDSLRPLLLHYHPLKIYSRKTLKQPDVLLAHFLAESYTSFEIMENNYRYYEPMTTHDSSLSYCVHGIMACRVNQHKHAEDFFTRTLFLDIDDLQGNTKDGLHMANLAGAAMYIPYGFLGLRISAGAYSINPVRPKSFPRYSLSLRIAESLIGVSVQDTITIKLIEGSSIKIWVYGEAYNVSNVAEIELREMLN